MTSLIDTLASRKAFTSDGLQMGWDSVSLGAAKKCPRYYLYSILLGYTPKALSPHLHFGILFHAALERLDHIKVKRPLTDLDLASTLRQAMRDAGSVSEDGTFIPWNSENDKKNLESLVRSIIWYVDEYRNDAYSVIQLASGAAAVELSFRFDTGLKHAGESFLYCGHLDSLGTYAGNVYGLDRKSTGGALTQSFFAGFNPSVQITGYNLASKLVYNTQSKGVIIDAMQVGAGFVRFGRQVVAVTEGQMEEWLVGTNYTLNEASKWLEEKYWPMNETACNMYLGCTFRDICSKDPQVREMFLNANFTTRMWDPLEPRGVDA